MTTTKILDYINKEVSFSGVYNTPIDIQDIVAEMNSTESSVKSLLDQLVMNNSIEYCAIGDTCVRLK